MAKTKAQISYHNGTLFHLWAGNVRSEASAFSRAEFCYPHAEQLDALAGDRTAQDLWREAPSWTAADEHRLAVALERLDPEDADIFELGRNGAAQREIGLIFGLTQVAISYRLSAATKRLRILLSIPAEVTEETIRRDLKGVVTDKQLEILAVYFRCWNFGEVARLIGIKSGRCYHNAAAALRAINRQHRPDLQIYGSVFQRLMFDEHRVSLTVISASGRQRRKERMRSEGVANGDDVRKAESKIAFVRLASEQLLELRRKRRGEAGGSLPSGLGNFDNVGV